MNDDDDTIRTAAILGGGKFEWYPRADGNAALQQGGRTLGMVWEGSDGDWYWRANKRPLAGAPGDEDWVWWEHYMRREQEHSHANKGCEPDGKAATLAEAKRACVLEAARRFLKP